jgi:hypothetical protein
MVLVFFSCEKYGKLELDKLHYYNKGKDSLLLECNLDEIELSSDVILKGYLNDEAFCYDSWDVRNTVVAVTNSIIDLYEDGYVDEKIYAGVSVTSYHEIKQLDGFQIIFSLVSPIIKDYNNYEDSLFETGNKKVFKNVTFTSNGVGEKSDYKIEDAWEFYFGWKSDAGYGAYLHFFSESNGTLEIINVDKIDYGPHIEYDVTYHIYGELDCPFVTDIAGTICYDLDMEWIQTYYIPGE